MIYHLKHYITGRPPYGGESDEKKIPAGEEVKVLSESLAELGKPTVALIESNGVTYEVEWELFANFA